MRLLTFKAVQSAVAPPTATRAAYRIAGAQDIAAPCLVDAAHDFGRFGFALRRIWGRFRVHLGSGVDLWSVWGRSGVGLGSIWGRSEVDVGSIRNRSGVDLG